MKAFLRNYSLRLSCYECNFKGFPRSGDITLGDFWGIDIVKTELDDDRGVSLISLNTEKGIRAFEAIKGSIFYVESNIDDVSRFNPCLLKPVEKPSQRATFWGDFDKMPFGKFMLKYFKAQSKLKFLARKIKLKFNNNR